MTESDSVRIDKWLWAARFFKTRSLAQQAVEGGRVRLDGQRVKPSRAVRIGQHIVTPRGEETWEVQVIGLSEKRLGAPLAALLYAETDDSMAARTQAAADRRLAWQGQVHTDHRPSKKKRRDLQRFRDRNAP